jgi:hypothetical protein
MDLAYERRGMKIESLDGKLHSSTGHLPNEIEEVARLECARVARAAGEMGDVTDEADWMVGIDGHGRPPDGLELERDGRTSRLDRAARRMDTGIEGGTVNLTGLVVPPSADVA